MKPSHWYGLNKDGEPVAMPEHPMGSAGWLEVMAQLVPMLWQHPLRQVAREEVAPGVEVSTVFLGLNHNWGSGPPIYWESMAFGGSMNMEMDRCSGSREQALAMHAAFCERVRAVEALRE